MRTPFLLLVLLLAAACAGKTDVAAKPPPPWQKVIREPDRQRLAGLWSAWTRSLGEAEKAGMMPKVAALGTMAVPDAARAAAFPAPGAYRCRTVTLGIRAGGMESAPVPAMTTAPFAPCSIAPRDGVLWLEQPTGPRRIGGRLFPDGDRMVFLGSQALAGEMGIMPYGADGQRDQVGVLRAHGDNRWRLELPWPMWQSNLTLMEIVPA